ncbi:Broad specificity phosphatase PhoE [Marininema mesophilum]|uniref:Broad specificity phosphatase PhoE n=1 Tax=Marininema mesophilum TaxID=1048340 RepID=A0A1H2T9L2_9BACL|nr:histidine phosphatase family protein [Marininema mesophilum]SDW39974.1 Broad specificity phosphatase PhoE [Marininema mesophilum]
MKLIFLRHGEAQHNSSEPESFQITHPKLTPKGIQQALNLQKHFRITNNDIVVVSPTYRTLETANIFAREHACSKYLCYAIGPRIYPYREGSTTLPCDKVMSRKELIDYITDDNFKVLIGDFFDNKLDSVNHVSEYLYKNISLNFMEWCRRQKVERIFIVSHDGTINHFKEIIINKKFTRDDMLNEGEYISLEI